MTFLSFNCRGIANAQKNLALKHLLKNVCCDVIMLRETLGPRDFVMNILRNMSLGWSFVALDASGRLGGLTLGIKDCSLKLLNS